MSIDFQSVRDANPLFEVVARYVDIRRRGNVYYGKCPFHDDTNPSFNVYEGDDQIWRYRCHACGESGDVIDFVSTIEGCDTAEAVKRLSGGNLPPVGTYVPKTLPRSQINLWEPIVPAPPDAPEYVPEFTFNPNRGRKVNYQRCMERLDPYYGPDGSLLFYVIRLRFSDGKKACPVITYCKGPKGERAWTAKRMKAPYPLQGLDELAARPNANVMLVSGEKCKAALSPVFTEYVVISWLGGDEAVNESDWSPLAAVDKIYLWPDADKSGNTAMNRIAKIVDGIEKSGTG